MPHGKHFTARSPANPSDTKPRTGTAARDISHAATGDPQLQQYRCSEQHRPLQQSQCSK
ncbi:hypothetical protein GCM10025331_37090 [Actinoplanes utahensis]|nr:hypothetical protein Aut01nite_46610 [Actinoplanes utahensis]